MLRILSLTKRNIKEILREPVSLIFLIALPIAMQILFYYMFHSLTTQFEMKYLAPGLIGFANTFLCLFVAILVANDRQFSFITRIYTTPVTSFEFIMGYLLSAIPFGFVQVFAILLVGVIIDVSLLSLSLLLIFPLSLISILLFASMGILFGSLFGTKAVGGIASIVVTGQSILSGMWFPVEGMSEGFITFMKVLPFKNVSMLFQNVATPSLMAGQFEGIWLPIIIITGYTLLSVVLSCICFLKNSKNN